MGKYKLIALDMDGTVLNEEQKISDTNKKWIHAAFEAGVPVMFSTGRGIQSALPYVEELGLKTPIVTVNGSEVWKEPHVLLKRELMQAELIERMRELALQHDTWYWAYSVEGIFNKETWTSRDMESVHWLKFGYYMENTEILRQIRETLEPWGVLEITNSHPFNIECNPKGINKASGLKEVCGLLGISMSEVVAMGDSLNDISMIRAAGLGVAMGNAQEQIKQAADVVTLTNDEDGVAEAIRKYVLND